MRAKQSNSHLKCPCCSGKSFADCCAPFLNEEKCPETAVQLMRSRYAAYSMAKLSLL